MNKRILLLISCFLSVTINALFPTISSASTIYSVGGSNFVPSNTIGSSQDILNVPGDYTIQDIKLTATFHPGLTSAGDTVPLQAGEVWLKLTRRDLVSGARTNIMLFDFPTTYPVGPNPPCSSSGIFDHSCINTSLNGAYVFADGNPLDFDSEVIASIDGTLVPGNYHSSIDSLDRLVGLNGNAMYTVSAASLSSNTFGSLDWQLELTAVPIPAASWLFGAGLIGLVGFAKRNKA